MPKRSRSKVTAVRKYAKKYKTTFRPTMTPRSFPSGTRRAFNLRYCSRITVNPGVAGIASEHFFAANGLFDPDVTGVGHQPLGFDQIMPLYDHYVVTKACMKVWFTNEDEANGVIVYLALRDAVTVEPILTDNIENGGCVYTCVSQNTGGKSQGYLTIDMDIGKYLGGRDPLTDHQLKGNSTTNPVESAFIAIGAAPLNTSDHAGLNMFVTIDYKGYFVEPRQLLGS